MVDNASQNQEADIISQKFPHVKVIKSDKNLGFAGGNNLGIKAAQGRYLFLVNNEAIGFGEKDHGQYDTAHPTPYAHGAAMLIKREAIEKVGLMHVHKSRLPDMVRAALYHLPQRESGNRPE